MRLILVGCEYAGTTTVAVAVRDWAREQMGIELGPIHDHWKIPYTVTHYPARITEEEADQYMALSPRLKEALQRHCLYYHLVSETDPSRAYRRVGIDGDQIVVGYHIEDTIYADLYYTYGGEGQAGDRVFHSRRIEDRIVRLAPETVLVHVWARPEIIRQRMRDAPHPRPVVREADVELVCRRFRDAVNNSAIRNGIGLDTSDAIVDQTLQQFAAAVQPFLTDEDRARAAGASGPKAERSRKFQACG